MVTWTKQAEEDYKQRHPHRECIRRAGEQATYDGKAITRYHTVYDGFMQRGWLSDPEYERICEAKEKTAKFCQGRATTQQIIDRWRLMIAITRKKKIATLKELAKSLGLRDAGTLSIFCQQRGRELAKKYGKLGKIDTLNKGVWLEIMEQ